MNKLTKILSIGLVSIFALCAVASGSGDKKDKSNGTNATTAETTQQKYTLGSNFTFDQLDITIGTDLKKGTVDNSFSDKNGQDYIIVPIHVTNLSNENHGLNYLYVKAFGSKGTKADIYYYYEDDADISKAGEMRSGASNDINVKIMYDGDGTYCLTFDDWSNEINVEFDVALANIE